MPAGLYLRGICCELLYEKSNWPSDGRATSAQHAVRGVISAMPAYSYACTFRSAGVWVWFITQDGRAALAGRQKRVLRHSFSSPSAILTVCCCGVLFSLWTGCGTCHAIGARTTPCLPSLLGAGLHHLPLSPVLPPVLSCPPFPMAPFPSGEDLPCLPACYTFYICHLTLHGQACYNFSIPRLL